jgi:hypothetical protein
MPDSIEESQKAQLPKIRPHGLETRLQLKGLGSGGRELLLI